MWLWSCRAALVVGNGDLCPLSPSLSLLAVLRLRNSSHKIISYTYAGASLSLSLLPPLSLSLSHFVWVSPIISQLNRLAFIKVRKQKAKGHILFGPNEQDKIYEVDFSGISQGVVASPHTEHRTFYNELGMCYSRLSRKWMTKRLEALQKVRQIAETIWVEWEVLKLKGSEKGSTEWSQ